MGETSKQVRVDNWGIFFLQRLQIFFNKTDYCDLTLQFEGNVQLKVHRLVMNACTDYFNVLEQTCEVIDGNIIIMPPDLQADVILPIVNFMYTGMLEFQMSIFDRLYNTAAIMNIPVLTKLLDAQKKPIAPLQKFASKKQQPTWNLHGKKITPKVENDLPATLPGRKLPVWKRKSAPAPAQHLMVPHYHQETKRVPQDPLATFDNTPKPTRFEWPEDEINSTFNLMDNSFDDISYTSKPLLTQEDELRASTSFDEIRHASMPHKKSKDLSNQSIDMEEVKNYVKEQKIRSDLVEYEDEDDPDSYLEHIIPDKTEVGTKRKSEKTVSPTSKRVRFSINEKENKETKINVTPSGKVSDMNHTKIISEVLRKYPHLVKKNKNIRLKILAKSPVKAKPETQKVQAVKTTSKLRVQVSGSKGIDVNLNESNKNQDEGPWVCNKCSTPSEVVEFVLYYLYRKHMTDVHNEKFDSRMCKFCGHQSNKHNMLMYHQYTRHGIKPPPAYNFPKCNRCPYIALTENLLIKHKLNHTKFDLQCSECKVAFNSQGSLASHIQITGHTGKSGRNSYDCQYCTKRYHTGSNLFSHIKLAHRNEARRDGIVSIDESEDLDDEQPDEESEEYIVPEIQDGKEKIKIISNIKVPSSENETETQVTQHEEQPSLEANVESDSLNNVTGGIATSLGLVDIVVLDENQQYILHNDQQLVTQQSLTNNQPEYILPEISSDQQNFSQTQNITEVITSEHNVITQSMLNNSDIASTDELVMVLTDHDYNDGNSEILTNENSNIVVLYSHPVSGEQNQFITSQGNLMLNSQTGLLELRNSTPETETHETPIESIEMIQREINSHNNIIPNAEGPIKPELVHICTGTDTTTANVEEPLTHSLEILEENRLANEQENVELSEKEVTVEINDECVGHTEELISTTHDSEMADSPQAEMEDETMHVTGDTEERNLQEEGNLQEESMEIDEECAIMENTQQVHAEDEKPDQESTSAELPSESFTEDMESQKEQYYDTDKQEDLATDTRKQDSENVADFPEHDDANELISEQTEVIKAPEQLTANDVEEEKECAEISTDVCDQANNEQQITVVGDNNTKNSEEDTAGHDEQAEIQQKEQDEDLQPPVLSPQIDINRSETEQQNSSQSPILHPEVDTGEIEAHNIEIDESSRPQQDIAEPHSSCKDLETGETQTPTELGKDSADAITADDSEEGKVVINDDEMSQNTDDNSQNQVLSESGEEAGKGDETVDIENDNSETIDDDNSQSQDSQLSQSSQDSSKQENEKPMLKRNPCHATKISILDDWEDTNSQQSDSNGKKAEITVNKLIHDWDDDEEEDEEDEFTGQVEDT